MGMKERLIEQMSKESLRKVVKASTDLDEKKVDKMPIKRLKPHVEKLSFNEIKKLSNQ